MSEQQSRVVAPPRWHLRSLILLGSLPLLLGLAAFAGLVLSRKTPTPVSSREPEALATEAEERIGPPWFRNKTDGSGLHFSYRNGEEAGQCSILESVGGGVALIDYDGDGLLDIFVTGGGYFDGPDKKTLKGYPCKLYRNLGGWKFEDADRSRVGLDIVWGYTHGVAVADYDRDGWPDLLVTGYGKVTLFHNESDGKGGRRFVDVTEQVGLHDDSWSTSAGWADLDGDGFPDLYICHYLDWSFANHPICTSSVSGDIRDVCSPERFKPLVHALFHNEKGKAFRNVSAEHGFEAKGSGLGVILADLNDDGRPDIYVANDVSDKFLFLNRGGKLEERALLAGVSRDDSGLTQGSMGLDVGDFDGSGRPSLWVTNFQGQLPALYRNLGQENFRYASRVVGVAAIGQHLVSWGTGFLDVDNDGWEDLVIVNGRIAPSAHHPREHCEAATGAPSQCGIPGEAFFPGRESSGGRILQYPRIRPRVMLPVGDLDN